MRGRWSIAILCKPTATTCPAATRGYRTLLPNRWTTRASRCAGSASRRPAGASRSNKLREQAFGNALRAQVAPALLLQLHHPDHAGLHDRRLGDDRNLLLLYLG